MITQCGKTDASLVNGQRQTQANTQQVKQNGGLVKSKLSQGLGISPRYVKINVIKPAAIA